MNHVVVPFFWACSRTRRLSSTYILRFVYFTHRRRCRSLSLDSMFYDRSLIKHSSYREVTQQQDANRAAPMFMSHRRLMAYHKAYHQLITAC